MTIAPKPSRFRTRFSPPSRSSSRPRPRPDARPAVLGQAPAIKPVTVLQPMPDFTLASLQGGEVTLSKLKGKNVLLIFPRGLVGEGSWCHIDNYQYSDPAETEKLQAFRKALNLEVLFVMPYGRALVQQWADKFVDQFQDIESLSESSRSGVARRPGQDPHGHLHPRSSPRSSSSRGERSPFRSPSSWTLTGRSRKDWGCSRRNGEGGKPSRTSPRSTSSTPKEWSGSNISARARSTGPRRNICWRSLTKI